MFLHSRHTISNRLILIILCYEFHIVVVLYEYYILFGVLTSVVIDIRELVLIVSFLLHTSHYISNTLVYIVKITR